MLYRALIVAIVLLCTVTARAKIVVGDQVSGWASYTQNIYLADGKTFNPVATDWIKQLSPAGGVLRMVAGAEQIPGDVTTTNWSQRSTNNLVSITVESEAALANLTHNRLWVGIPVNCRADISSLAAMKNSFAYQKGLLLGKTLDPRLGYVDMEYGNEEWNGGDQSNGTANLFAARADPELTLPDDTGRMAQKAYKEWYKNLVAFEQGVKDSGSTLKVRGKAPGFIANPYFASNGLSFLKAKYDSPKLTELLARSRVIIAPYAPGSPTDIGGIAAADTKATIMARTDAFVKANFPTWFAGNKGVADYFGLAGLDFYETMALSTYDFTSGTNVLVDLNRSAPEARAYLRDFMGYVADLADGKLDGKNADPDATLIIFGSAGIPYSENFGQWSPKEFYDSPISPKAQGILDFIATNAGNVDPFTNVPEPAALAALPMVMLLARRRGRR